jgi:general L-amino acid transport system permease protein
MKSLYQVKRIGIQLVALLIIAGVGHFIYIHTQYNIQHLNLNYGFEFLHQESGFDISFSLIEYSSKSTNFHALLVGLINTVLISILGILFSSFIGISVGIASLSNTLLIQKFAKLYINIVRNIPLLAQLLFWYNLLINTLPHFNKSLNIIGLIYINNRGLALPQIHAPWLFIFTGLLSLYLMRTIITQKTKAIQYPAFMGIAVIIALVSLNTQWNFDLHLPQPSRFNFENATLIPIELFCLLIGLSTYIGSFIAEIVRAGLLSIHRNQYESAYSLGMKHPQIIRQIIIPQALPLMIPPALNQYLNLLKASSLAVAIGFPDLVSIFTGTVLNQTGQALEIILITMGVYLAFNTLISFLINRYNNTQMAWKSNADNTHS